MCLICQKPEASICYDCHVAVGKKLSTLAVNHLAFQQYVRTVILTISMRLGKCCNEGGTMQQFLDAGGIRELSGISMDIARELGEIK